MNTQSGHIAERIRVCPLHKQENMDDSTHTGNAQTQQDFYADRMVQVVDADRGVTVNQHFRDGCLVVKIWGDGVTASTTFAAGEEVGVDLEVFHADESTSARNEPGTFSEYDLDAGFDLSSAFKTNQYVDSGFLKLRQTVENSDGSLIVLKCNLDVSRMKRFLKVRVTPQFDGSSAAAVDMDVELILADAEILATEDVHELNIT